MFSQLRAGLTGGFFGGLIVGLLLGPIPAMAQTRAATLTPTNPKFQKVSIGSGAADTTHPFNATFNQNSDVQLLWFNNNAGTAAFAEIIAKSDTNVMAMAASGLNSLPAINAGRGELYSNTAGASSNVAGVDIISCASSSPTGCFTRFIVNSADGSAGGEKARIDLRGVVVPNTTAFVASTGATLAVANVGANSCGTTTATIAGAINVFVITVGATSGTQCRVLFPVAAATEYDCTANDDTTTVAVRTTPVDTTHTDFIGAFTAGDKVTGICFPR